MGGKNRGRKKGRKERKRIIQILNKSKKNVIKLFTNQEAVLPTYNFHSIISGRLLLRS